MSRSIIVYYRHGCHLCEQMVASLQEFRHELKFKVRIVDIDDDPVLAKKYNADVPVALLDGVVIFNHFFDKAALLKALDQTGE